MIKRIGFAVILVLFVVSYAYGAATLFPYPKFTAIDSNGDPLSGGKVYTYITGTTTNKTTWIDADKSSANANPVILDSNGQANIWLDGDYRLVLKTSADVTLWTVDDVDSLVTLDVVLGVGAVYPQQYGAAADGVTDDTTAIQDALDASKYVYLPAGTYLVSSALLPQSGGWLIGAGTGRTTILNDAIGGAILKAPAQRGRLADFTVDGQDVSGSVGIFTDDTYRPYAASWGHIRVIDCTTGVSLNVSGSGGAILYNSFGPMHISGCTTGLLLKTDAGTSIVNANRFESVFINDCTTGLQVNGADGNAFGFVVAEIGTTGIDMVDGDTTIILGGWLEGLTTNIVIADAPAVRGFVYMGSSDDSLSNYTYVVSTGRSDLIAHSAQYYSLSGRWFFDYLEGNSSDSFLKVKAISLLAAGTFGSADATPDVSGDSWFNTYTDTQIITDFDHGGGTISDGKLLFVVSKAAITYDVTTSGIKGGTTDIITAAGDVTTFIYDGTDWLVVARMDMSDDLN